MGKWKSIMLLGLFGMILCSCKTINSNRILFYEDGSTLKLDTIMPRNEYARLVPGDVLSVEFYANRGEQKIIGKGDEKSNSAPMNQTYVVDENGLLNLPLIGKIEVRGKTVEEVKSALEVSLLHYIKDPYVEVRLEQERVVLFYGKGEGKVVSLTHQNTSILEVVALGGGLRENTKSTEVFLIRRINDETKTYRFDLSSIQNIEAAEIYARNHDIIVVNYYPRKVQSALKEINPWLNLSTAGLALVSIILRFIP